YEFEQPQYGVTEAETVADSLVDFFRAGDAFLHHARRLIHGECLDARHDEAGRRRTYHWHFANAFKQALYARDDIRIGRLSRRYLDQRDQIGWIQPMHVEKTIWTVKRTGEIVDQNGRRRGSDGDVLAGCF